MVRGIDHLGDLGNGCLDGDLDPLTQGHIDLCASLATAAKLDVGRAIAHFEQIDIAAMGRDRGIDLPVEDLLHAGRHRIPPAFMRILDPQGPTHHRRIEVDGDAVEIRGAAWLNQHPQLGRLNHEVVGGRIGRCHEVKLVNEFATPPTGNRDPQAGVGMAALGAHAIDLRTRRRRDRDHGQHCRHSIRGQLKAMARILLLIPSRTYRTHDFMEAAGRLGIEVVVGSEHRPALAGLMKDRHLRLDFNDVKRSTARIVEYARQHSLSAVVAVDDSGTVLAASAAEALGLAHNPVAAVRAARDKSLMRERFQAAGLATPGYITIGIDHDPATIAGSLRFPSVVKPLDLSGSQGVIKVDDADSFPAVFKRVGAIVAACQPNGSRAAVLVEDFIPGDEFAVEALLRHGELEVLAIFDKPDPLDGPFFEETIYVTPSRLDAATQSRIIETTSRAARALGLRDGPIHAELRVNADGVWVLELAARSIGGLCSRTLRFGSGISLEELILRHAAGLPLPSHEREGPAAGVMMLPIPAAGRLRAVEGQAEAKQVPGIDGLVITIPPNEILTPLPEGDRYLGFMFARGETPADVEAGLRQAHARLRVVLDG